MAVGKQPGLRVAMRADASTAIGWGHLKRCLALADELCERGAQVCVFAAVTDVDAAALVRAAGFDCALLSAQDAIDDVIEWAPQIVVVDHYRLDASWHMAVRQASGARIAAIDDLADRPLDADLVIDQNPGPGMAARYAPVLQREAVLCAGLDHALLDAVYARHLRQAPSNTVRSIGIFMGGTDAGNFSAFAWRACRDVAAWRGPIEIASTRANPALPELRRICEQDPGVHLLLDQPNLADFHVRHGLQLGAGGGACWERCCLGTPAIVLVCAENQRASVPHLAAAGACIGIDAIGQLDTQLEALGRAVRDLLGQPARRLRMQAAGMKLVDGRGAERAAAAVLALIER